jgi:hypothetical protein
VVRQARLMAVVGAFLIGCAVLLLAVGCAGTRSEAPKEQEQGHAEATNGEQARTPEETTSEEGRCGGTRTFKLKARWREELGLNYLLTTNDLPGCPKGGLLLGTDKKDRLYGREGADEVRGLGGRDFLDGGNGNDVLYGGPGNDDLGDGPDEGDDVFYGGDGDDALAPGMGEDVLYGGDGNDVLAGEDGTRDKLYCGEGKDQYTADKIDYVDTSCEKIAPWAQGAPA